MISPLLGVAAALLSADPGAVRTLPAGFSDTERRIALARVESAVDLEDLLRRLMDHLEDDYRKVAEGLAGAPRHFEMARKAFDKKKVEGCNQELESTLPVLEEALHIHRARLEEREREGDAFSADGGPPRAAVNPRYNPERNRAVVRVLQSTEADTRLLCALFSLVLGLDEARVHHFKSLAEQKILFGNPYLEELHRLAAELSPLRSMGELKGFGRKGRGSGSEGEGRPCPRCERLVPPGATFCPNCGLRQGKPGVKICPNCEHENPVDANFCNKCNYKFKSFKGG